MKRYPVILMKHLLSAFRWSGAIWTGYETKKDNLMLSLWLPEINMTNTDKANTLEGTQEGGDIVMTEESEWLPSSYEGAGQS